MLARDIACALLGWALALAFWLGAARLPRSMLSDAFGADGLPKGLALALAGVSTLIVVRALWLQHRGQTPIFRGEENGGLTPHLKALGIVAIGFGYVLLAPWIGFLPAVAVLILATTLYYGAAPRPMAFAMAVVGAVVLWLIFARMLGVSMPVGFWAR